MQLAAGNLFLIPACERHMPHPACHPSTARHHRCCCTTLASINHPTTGLSVTSSFAAWVLLLAQRTKHCSPPSSAPWTSATLDGLRSLHSPAHSARCTGACCVLYCLNSHPAAAAAATLLLQGGVEGVLNPAGGHGACVCVQAAAAAATCLAAKTRSSWCTDVLSALFLYMAAAVWWAI